MPDQDREKEKERQVVVEPSQQVPAAVATSAKIAPLADEDPSNTFISEPLVGFDPGEISGTLIVIEGMDGSGRSTQISLLQEWLESEGFAVQTSGLRRSNLVDATRRTACPNAVTRLTLALMYCTDFFDQLEHRIAPALKSTRLFWQSLYFTLIARSKPRHQPRLFERAVRRPASVLLF
jgi:hypothetical protein